MTAVLGDITAAGEDVDVNIDELGTVLESLSKTRGLLKRKPQFLQQLKLRGIFLKKILSSKSAFDGLVLRLSDYVEIWRSFV